MKLYTTSEFISNAISFEKSLTTLNYFQSILNSNVIKSVNRIITEFTINILGHFNQFAFESAHNFFPSFNLSLIIYRSCI